MGNLSHSKEVEESISEEKSAETVVSVETDSEECASLNEPIIAENSKESCGENEETEGRISELEVKKAASEESSLKIAESIDTGDYASASECINNAETTISEPSVMVNGENKEERNVVTECLHSSLQSPNEERLFKVNEAVAAKGRKYRETVSDLQAKRESLKLEYPVLANELVAAKDEEQGLCKTLQGIKENASTLNSRLDAQNKSQREHEKVLLSLESLHEKISLASGGLIQLKNENSSLRKQVKATQMEVEHQWDTLKREESKELEEIGNLRRKIQEEEAELERLEGTKIENRDKYGKAQEASRKKDREMKFVEKKYAGARSLYNGDIRDLTEGHAVMKAYVEDAKGKFDQEMASLEVNFAGTVNKIISNSCNNFKWLRDRKQ